MSLEPEYDELFMRFLRPRNQRPPVPCLGVHHRDALDADTYWRLRLCYQRWEENVPMLEDEKAHLLRKLGIHAIPGLSQGGWREEDLCFLDIVDATCRFILGQAA